MTAFTGAEPAPAGDSQKKARIEWIDYAKGFCIIMVVMFQATHGVEDRFESSGWMHDIVEFATPFRMPDFFLVSGLLLSAVIGRDWRTYLDRKVLHFAYFYVLWLTINFAFKAPAFAAEDGWVETAQAYLLSFVSPFASLWFIYLLPIFFVVTKLLRRVHPLWVFALAAAIEMGPSPGIRVLDKFCTYFVFFYVGYICAPRMFALARLVQARRGAAVAALLAWAGVNGWLVALGYAAWPGFSLVLGVLGAGAVISISALVMRYPVFRPIAYCGKHSIVIYLAYFIPMATTRIVLMRYEWITDVGWLSFATTCAGVVGALLIYWMVRGTRLKFLFERPAFFQLRAERTGGQTAPAATA